MKTKALRLYGENDIRLEEFEIPEPTADELLVRIVSDSLCMSSYKAAKQASAHKRVPANIATNPVVIGHEFCGEIIKVGANIAGRYKAGQKFTLQPAMKGTYEAAGYSFEYLGGDMQYAIVPKCYIDQDCVLIYEGNSFYQGSLTEPISCVIGAAHANYHTTQGEYTHSMGIKKGGNMAVLAACGPMGIALIDYIIHCDRKPAVLVVTDIDNARIGRAAELLTVEEAKKHGIELTYINTGTVDDPVKILREHVGGAGYDDVFVFAPVAAVIEQADAILSYDGCLNFFAGPTNTEFSAKFNFYNVHYNATHIVGTSGGNTDDMREALELASQNRINPSILLTHIGGLNAAGEATKNLPNLPGFKKLIYTGISMPLTAISEFSELGGSNAVYKKLSEICERHSGLWSEEAEKYLLENAPSI
jgi:threonine dehydrogenase-like Zn-dependent dehydrogenase